ncbi:MAG: 3-hydroxyacyl-ACP dehydratase [Ramlibacter sp.]
MQFETGLLFAADHPAFAGHFPGAPIVPGVLLLDAAVHAFEQASGLAVNGVAIAKFLQPVTPGEALRLACKSGENGQAAFEITRGTQRAATGRLLAGPGA